MIMAEDNRIRIITVQSKAMSCVYILSEASAFKAAHKKICSSLQTHLVRYPTI